MTILHNLLNGKIYKDIIKSDNLTLTSNITYDTYNFVDDSTSIISFNKTIDIKNYLTHYYKLLHIYYTTNKLQINSDKTQLMLTYKPKHKQQLQNFHFKANNDIIENSTTLKILGYTIRHNLDMTTQIGNVCANLHHRIHNIRQLTNITNNKTRQIFINSLVMGKLYYALPLYTQVTKKQLNMIQKVIMTAARAIIGSYFLKQTTNYIITKYNMLTAKQQLYTP